MTPSERIQAALWAMVADRDEDGTTDGDERLALLLDSDVETVRPLRDQLVRGIIARHQDPRLLVGHAFLIGIELKAKLDAATELERIADMDAPDAPPPVDHVGHRVTLTVDDYGTHKQVRMRCEDCGVDIEPWRPGLADV